MTNILVFRAAELGRILESAKKRGDPPEVIEALEKEITRVLDQLRQAQISDSAITVG